MDYTTMNYTSKGTNKDLVITMDNGDEHIWVYEDDWVVRENYGRLTISANSRIAVIPDGKWQMITLVTQE
jgi:hypothetical protein